jgi:uncharacterized protein (DUF302 family)
MHYLEKRNGKMFKIIRVLAATLLVVGLSQQALAEGAHMAVFTKRGSFADVRESVEMAITGRGFVISSVSHVGDMLERTGKDLGSGKLVFLNAESLEFCSATLSRKMMEADPDNIVFCPYIISIYVVPAKPNEVRVAYRKAQMVGSPSSQKALKAVNVLLSEIIKEAVE